jgi:hypothetical protein
MTMDVVRLDSELELADACIYSWTGPESGPGREYAEVMRAARASTSATQHLETRATPTIANHSRTTGAY